MVNELLKLLIPNFWPTVIGVVLIVWGLWIKFKLRLFNRKGFFKRGLSTLMLFGGLVSIFALSFAIDVLSNTFYTVVAGLVVLLVIVGIYYPRG